MAKNEEERFSYQLATTLEQADRGASQDGLRQTVVSDCESELCIQKEEGRKTAPPASSPGWSKLVPQSIQGHNLDWGLHDPGDPPWSILSDGDAQKAGDETADVRRGTGSALRPREELGQPPRWSLRGQWPGPLTGFMQIWALHIAASQATQQSSQGLYT